MPENKRPAFNPDSTQRAPHMPWKAIDAVNESMRLHEKEDWRGYRVDTHFLSAEKCFNALISLAFYTGTSSAPGIALLTKLAEYSLMALECALIEKGNDEYE